MARAIISTGGAEVTVSDTAVLPISGSLYIETGGDLKFVTLGGDTLTISVPDNHWLPVAVKQVYSTGTTASGIFVFY